MKNNSLWNQKGVTIHENIFVIVPQTCIFVEDGTKLSPIDCHFGDSYELALSKWRFFATIQPMKTNSIISFSDVTKHYARMTRPALDTLNLTIEQGEIFGYLGPNGAGKTTTIRIMLDLIRPTAGRVTLFGLDAQADSVTVKHMIGNLPGELRLWGHLTGAQIIDYLAGLRPNVDLDYACTLAERLQLDLQIKADAYSTGNKRKLGLVQAFMHRPALLILDEPTTGLDPLMRHVFNTMLREVQNEGTTVFLSSHILSEVQASCNRVAILREGRLRTVNSIHALREAHYRIVTIHTQELQQIDTWHTLPNVTQAHLISDGVQLHVTGSPDAVIKQAAHFTVTGISIDEPRLEDVFMAYYGADDDTTAG